MEPTEADATLSRIDDGARMPTLVAEAPDLEDPSLYFNRELSWLDFNDRVLQLAEDPSVPLLERIKFCAIWESNLDEFVMVRVANLQEQVEAGVDARAADALSAREQIAEIRERVVAQRHRLERCFERELRPALAEHGIRIVSATSADEGHSEDLHELFRRQVFPALTPLVIGLGRPFPYISNLSLSLAVLLRDPEQDNEILARVKVPTELLGRFLSMGSDEATLIPLEDLIAANLGELFLGMEVLDHSFFRVTRDTDYDVSDEADNLLQAVEEELKRRRFEKRGREAGGRERDEPAAAGAARVGSRDRGRRGLRGRGDARLLGPVRGRGPAGLHRAPRPSAHPGHPAAAAGRGRRRGRRVRRDARGRRDRAPPV